MFNCSIFQFNRRDYYLSLLPTTYYLLLTIYFSVSLSPLRECPASFTPFRYQFVGFYLHWNKSRGNLVRKSIPFKNEDKNIMFFSVSGACIL
jgi:hypothetical protein